MARRWQRDAVAAGGRARGGEGGPRQRPPSSARGGDARRRSRKPATARPRCWPRPRRPGPRSSPADGELRLTVADRRVLLPWIAAYATGATTMRQPLGWVSFRGPRRQVDVRLDPDVAARRRRAVAARHARGGRRRSLARRGRAAGAQPRADPHHGRDHRDADRDVGHACCRTMAAVAAVADGKDPTPALDVAIAAASVTAEAAASADADADTGGAPVHSLRESPAVLVTADGTGGVLGVTPLFSGAARRRESIKFVFAGEAGLTRRRWLDGLGRARLPRRRLRRAVGAPPRAAVRRHACLDAGRVVGRAGQPALRRPPRAPHRRRRRSPHGLRLRGRGAGRLAPRRHGADRAGLRARPALRHHRQDVRVLAARALASHPGALPLRRAIASRPVHAQRRVRFRLCRRIGRGCVLNLQPALDAVGSDPE